MTLTRGLRHVAGGLALVLAVGSVAIVSGAGAAFASGSPDMSLTFEGPGSELVGGQVAYSLTASNPSGSGATGYNASYRVVLPSNVSYVSGSAGTAGEPTVYTDQPTLGSTTLVWRNISDISPGGSGSLSFSAQPATASYPAGASLALSASVYVNTDPRVVPSFTNGVVNGSTATGSATTSSSTTSITPVQITKSVATPEGELPRGVHDHAVPYTLVVRNNSSYATTAVTVTDYLPASLEFLFCGATDNTGGGRVEYSGAPRLDAVSDLSSNCPTPTSVTTVTNPSGLAAGVYTRVVWALANLAAGASTTITYLAGVPLLRNTATFTTGTGGLGSLGQGANLDNNSGTSTAERATVEQSATNTATVSGTYSGPLASGATNPVSDSASTTVTLEDLALQKSVSPGQFAAGGVATYTLALQVSEYRGASGTVLSDHLPDGLCPLSSATNFATDSSASQCAPTTGTDPVLRVDGVTTAPASGTWYNTVTELPDGSFDIVFKALPALPADAVVSLTFSTRMRSAYVAGASAPTAAGDSFNNTVSLTSTSTPLAGASPPDPQSATSVIDDSSASMSSSGPSIDKQVASRSQSVSCGTATYFDPTTSPDTRPAFHEGDRACFRLAVSFPGDNYTRNPRVTDFLPTGLTYDSGSAATTGSTVGGITLDTSQASSGVLVWTMGASSSGALYAAPGAVFVVTFSATVTASAGTLTPDVAGNLMKFRSENTAGVAVSLRDSVDVLVTAAPPVSVLKGVASVNGSPVNGSNTANTDGVAVRSGDTVVFRVTVGNDGSSANQNAIPVHSLQVWDVLPSGLTCADVSSISDSGTCSAPGTVTGYGSNALLRWSLPSSDTLSSGSTRAPLTYTVAIPTSAVAGSTITNTAAVRSYAADSNISTTTTHYPTSNVDPTVASDDQDAPAASDVSSVVVPAASIVKTTTTSISETGNTLGAQATIGELVTWTVLATLPHDTTVRSGSLTDPMPTGLDLVSATLDWSSDAGSTFGSPPSGASVASTSVGATVTLPSVHVIDATDDVVRLVITARVSTTSSNTHGTVRTNTASLSSAAGPIGSTPSTVTGSASVTVVEPSTSLAKSNDATGTVVAAQIVTYTLTAGNTSGRPPAHDAFVVDCLPNGLGFLAWGSGTTLIGTVSGPTAGDGTNGCAAGYQRLEWSVGDIAGGASYTRTYTAQVDPAAGANVGYSNSATLVSSTLDGNDTAVGQSTSDERSYTSNASSSVTVQTATLTKSITSPSPARAPVGATVSFTVVATIPASVNLYDAAIIDTMPPGLDATTLSTTSVTCSPSCSVPGTALSSSPSGSNTLVGWLLGDLASGTAPRTVTIQATATVSDIVASTAGSTVTNRARLKWNVSDGSSPTSAGATFAQQSNQPSASVTVQEPSLTIAKATSDSTPEPGESFTYTVTVTNASGTSVSSAYGLSITDLVPTGVVVSTPSISNSGSYNSTTRTITWSGLTVAPASSVTLTYSATLAASSTLTTSAKTNTATIGSYTSQSGGGRSYSGGSTATSVVTPALPFVTPVKTAVSGTTAYVGSSFAWRITATNSGGAAARSADITDVLPANWSYDAGSAQVSINGGSASQIEPNVSGQTLTWSDLGTIAVAQTVVVTFTATPGSGATTSPGVGGSNPHVNTASANVEDGTGASASASGSYVASPSTASAYLGSADLVMTKAHSGSFVAGGSGSFTLDVGNNGPSTAEGPFTVSDTLPTGLVPTAAAGTGWSCSVVTQTVSCTRSSSTASLASGSSFPTIVVTVSIASTLAEGAVLSNTASVTGRTFDPVGSNNSSTDRVTVTRRADLGIVKQLASSVTAGSSVSWTIDVHNYGPSSATGSVTVTDTLASTLSFVSASGLGWSCAASGQVVTCTRSADLASGSPAAQIALTATLAASATGTLTNSAHVASSSTDPVSSNDDSAASGAIQVRADVAIAKSHIGTLVAGSPFVYEISVANTVGPSAARGVQVSDSLPAGMSLTSVTSVSGSWSCSGTTSVSCALSGTLGVGGTATVRLTVSTASSIAGSVINAATVTTTSTDANSANNSASDNSSSTTRADLVVSKSSPPSVHAGESLAYTLSIGNSGPSDTSGVATVTDVLPTGLTYVSASGSGWSCSYSSGSRTVTCVSSTVLASGAPSTAVTVNVTVNPGAGPAMITNSATVSGPDPDPNLLNNADDADVTVTDNAEISLAKTRTSASPARAGTVVTFAITVANAGPSDADDVSVTDTLPAGMTLVAVTGTGFTCSSGSAPSCVLASLGAGESATLTLTARIASSTTAGTLTNNATVTTSTAGDSSSNNSGSASVTATVSSDLRLDKGHRAGPAQAGGTATYTLVVSNDGPSDEPGSLTVVDALPLGISYVTSEGPWTCSAAASSLGETVTCTLAAGLIAGASAPELALVVAIDPTATAGTVTNTAVVTGGSSDPDSSNNDDDDDLLITTEADLSITKTHTGSVEIGRTVTFDIAVDNAGPSDAADLTITDVIPVGLAYVSASGSGWSCVYTSGSTTLACSRGSLAAGTASSVAVTATVLANSYPSVGNTATVSSSTPDPDSTDTTSSDSLVVPPQVDRYVTKVADGPLQVGANATYTIEVGNTGSTDDPGPIVLTDSLPAGLQFVSASGADWTCAFDTGSNELSCERADGLENGSTSSVQVTVLVLPEAYPSVTNVASVTGDADDTDSTNDTDSETNPVEPLVDLEVDKVLDEAGTTGDAVRWSISVTNNGPNTSVEAITVTDTLPSGITLTSAAGDGWSCASVAQSVTCTFASPMEVGEVAGFTIDASVAASIVGDVTNIAAITGGESGQVDESNNNSTAVWSRPINGFAVTGSGVCLRGVPWVSLTLAGRGLPASGPFDVVWTDEDGDTVQVDHISTTTARLLWPGTTLRDGVVVDWPGWRKTSSGTWVKQDDGLRPTLTITVLVPNSQMTPPTTAVAPRAGWLRSALAPVLAAIVVPASAQGDVTYPAASPACAGPDPDDDSGGLAPSGARASGPLALAGLVLMLLGGLAVVFGRRRSSH